MRFRTSELEMFIRMKERSDTTCRAFKGDEGEWEEQEEEDEDEDEKDDTARGEDALEKEEDAEEADPNKK